MFFAQHQHSLQMPAFSGDMLITYGASFKKVVRNEIIFAEGQKAQFFYFIESGSVKMYSLAEGDKEFIQGIFHAGESFGEPPVFTGAPYPATAIATENGVLLRMTRDRFMNMLKDNPEFHLGFTASLADRLLAKSEMMKEMSTHHPELRIMAVLRQYKKHCGVLQDESFKIPFTRQEIADMTGLRVETVIRTMKAMEDKGQLKIEHRKVMF